MRTLRLLTVAPLALALAAVASAQFDGPAPLAWRWVQPTTSAPVGAPVVNGDTIYTAVGGRVFSIDRGTGNLKWRYPQVDPVNGVFRAAPVLLGDVLVAAADNKIVYAIDPKNGTARWSYNSPSSVLGQPVAVGKYVVYATSDNKLIALDAATGKPVWEQPYNIYDGINGQIASYGGGVVYFTGSGKNELQSLDVVTKKANYRRPLKFSDLPPRATPVLYGDTFYVVSGLYLVAVNAQTGLTKWQRNTNVILAEAPAVNAEGIFVVSQDGDAMVYDPKDGRPLDSMKKGPIKLGSVPTVRPSAAGSKFVIPTSNGAINLFDPQTGKVLWSYVVRPIGQVYAPASNNAGSGLSGGGLSGGGGRPGATGGGTGGADQGRLITSLAASGPAVLAGQTLLVPARDGSILAFDKDLGVDLTPPTAKQVWPTPGDVVSGQSPLRLIFRLEDEAAGINETTIKVEIDGKPVYFAYTRDGYLQVAFSSLATPPTATTVVYGTLPGEETKSNVILQDGRHAVTVTATDWLGNVSTKTISVVIDNSLAPLALPGTAKPNPNGGFGGPGGPGSGSGR